MVWGADIFEMRGNRGVKEKLLVEGRARAFPFCSLLIEIETVITSSVVEEGRKLQDHDLKLDSKNSSIQDW
jgi:hypothetical protein